MQLITRPIQPNTNIFLFGDDHEGTRAKYDDGVKELIDTISTSYDGIKPDNQIGIHHGDIVEAIMMDDKRYDPANTKESSILQQIDNAGDTYYPIRNQLVTMLDGNHPRKLWRFSPNDPITARVCRRLDIPYGDWTSKITYTDLKGKTIFKQLCTHGSVSIGSKLADPAQAYAAKQRALKNCLRELAGDCLIMSMGHTHQLVDVEPFHRLYMYSDSERIHQDYNYTPDDATFIHPDERWYVNTGSFYCTQVVGHSTYGERAQYAPLPLGYYILKVRDYRVVGIERKLV